MSLSNKVVNIYSDYVIQPNTFTTYIIPSTGVTGAINITLPKIYNNTLEVASFRITNNSTYNAIIKYIANADDDSAGTLTTLVTIAGGSKAHVTIDDSYQKYEISDSSGSIDSNGVYLPLTGGTLTGTLNIGSNIIANVNGNLSAGKTYISGVSGGLPSTAISDLDIAQSANLDTTTATKTAGITLYGYGSSAGFGTSYILGIDTTGGLTLFKSNGTTVSRVATFDASSGITSINQQTPTGTGGGGQIANKTYVDTRYIVPPLYIVPNMQANTYKQWTISSTSSYNGDHSPYCAFSNATPGSNTMGGWATSGTDLTGSITISAPFRFILGGFSILARDTGFPSSWSISASNISATDTFLVLYTGNVKIGVTNYVSVTLDFKNIINGLVTFKYFRFTAISGATGPWGMKAFELYPATAVI